MFWRFDHNKTGRYSAAYAVALLVLVILALAVIL